MDRLPLELLHFICSSLDLKDVYTFRLLGKMFSEVGAYYSHREIFVYLHQDDLDHLLDISKKYSLARCVKSLAYMANTLKFPTGSFHKYKDDYKGMVTIETFIQNEYPESSMRIRPDLTQTQLGAAYSKYKMEVENCAVALRRRIDFIALREAIPRLTQLEKVVMSSGFAPYQLERKKTPFDNLFREPGGNIQPEGCHQLEAFLEALAFSPAKIRVLRAASLNWRFFDRDLETARRLFSPLSNLTRIKLYIDTWLNETNGIEQPDDITEIDKCRAAMDNGVLRTVLQSLDQLEVIEIQFTWHSDNLHFCAALDQVFSPTHKWSRLKALNLEGIEFERSKLTPILELHKDTLRNLCLRDINLVDTSWIQFLSDVRNTLDLDKCCICGWLYGRREDGTECDELWNLSIPEFDSTDGENPLRNAVNDYCCRRGGSDDQCPLLRYLSVTHYSDRETDSDDASSSDDT